MIYTIINFISMIVAYAVCTSAIACWMLMFFKYESVIERIYGLEHTSDRENNIGSHAVFAFFYAVGIIIDIAKENSPPLNATAIITVAVTVVFGGMVLLAMLCMGMENLRKKIKVK